MWHSCQKVVFALMHTHFLKAEDTITAPLSINLLDTKHYKVLTSIRSQSEIFHVDNCALHLDCKAVFFSANLSQMTEILGLHLNNTSLFLLLLR